MKSYGRADNLTKYLPLHKKSSASAINDQVLLLLSFKSCYCRYPTRGTDIFLKNREEFQMCATEIKSSLLSRKGD